MSGDEGLALVVSLGLAVVTWGRWYWRALWPPGIISRHASRWGMTVPPLISAIVLFAVLVTFSSHDVKSDPVYIGFYMAMGAAWVGLTATLLPLLGLNPRDDVVERRNAAAGPAVAGAVLGLTLAFAGANIGDGPGWWVVVFSAGLATAALAGLWLLAQFFSKVTDAVTIEREVAAGVRLGAMLVAGGLIFGRAVAGTWHSAEATLADFVDMGWPGAFLGVAEVLFGYLRRVLGPGSAGPALLLGGIPAIAYVGGAVIYVLSLGWWT